MNKPNTTALLAAASLGLAATAQADLTWHWTLSGDDNGSGTFTTTAYTSPTANSYYPGTAGYLVTGATGTFDTFTVNGVVNLADASTGSYGGWNQLLFPSDAIATAPVDVQGIELYISDPSNAYAGVFSPSGDTPPDLDPTHVDSGIFNSLTDYGGGHSVFTVTPAPEPSQVVSMLGLAGLGGVSLLGRLRRRN